MKRTWILVLVVATVCVAIASGLTLALFTAATPQSNAQFVAGTLELDAARDNGDTVPGPMFYIDSAGGLLETGLWAPGDTFHKVLQVENVGSLDAWLKTVRADLESGSRPLADKLNVKITTDPAGTNVVATGTLGQFIDADQAFIGGPISAMVGDVIDLHFWVELPLNADNTYQGLSAVAGFTIFADQQAHNP